jgi:hypothetical protein
MRFLTPTGIHASLKSAIAAALLETLRRSAVDQ